MSDVFEDMDGIAPADLAERWHARLMAPDCTLAEREQFETWLRQSPENALAFEDTRALWASLEGLENDEVIGPHVTAALESEGDPLVGGQVGDLLPSPQRKPGPSASAPAQSGTPDASNHRNDGQGRPGRLHVSPRRRTHAAPRRRRWPIAAGSVAALALVAVLLWPILKPRIPIETYATTTGIESLHLADGSSVQLDLQTVIETRFSARRRDIDLRQGRAMFEVAHDAARPFVVDAGVGTVTALGTKFQVRREGEQVSVTLLEGSVGIDAAPGSTGVRALRLVPGQRASYAPTTRSWSVEAVDPEALTSWSQGFHVFSATPLREALAQINRYSSIKLTLADPALGDLRLSGSYKLGDGKAVSEALPYALPVKTTEQAGGIVISRR